MTSINALTLEADDPGAAGTFYKTAFGLDGQVRVRPPAAESGGFRGFTVSLIVAQPADVNALFGSALDAGATALKPAAKSFWGYGGVLRAPDGAIWKIASAAKKDSGPASRRISQLVLLLGAADVPATRKFYTGRGLSVGKSFGSRYVEFATPGSPVGLGLYGYKALAKDAGVPPEGTGSHRLAVNSDAGPFTDPDGFPWESPAGRLPNRQEALQPLSSPVMNALEEGMRAELDFGKLGKIAKTGSEVLPVVLQNADTHDVLFVGYANEEALRATLDEKIAVLWSTSRNELWRKGATSGDTLNLVGVRVNCEQNSLLYLVRPATGGACHTRDSSGASRPTCYYRELTDRDTLRPA